MRKGWKTVLTVCLVVALIGATLLAAGIAAGGKLSFNVDLNRHRVDTGEVELVRGEYTPSHVSALVVDVDVADITLETGDAWRVEYALYYEPEIAERDGTLTLTAGGRGDWPNIGVNFGVKKAPYLRVTVPESTALGTIELRLDVGDTELRNLTLSSLQAQIDVGDLAIRGIVTDSLNAALNVGDCVVSGAAVLGDAELGCGVGDLRCDHLRTDGALHVYTDTGDIDLDFVTAASILAETDLGDIDMESPESGSINAATDTGEISAVLPGAETVYNLELRSNVGDVELNGRGRGNDYTARGGEKTFTATTDVGDVEVKFAAP